MNDDGIFIHQFELGPWENFIYFVGDRATRQCAVIDPAWNYEIILKEAEKLDITLTDILCTHSHHDHVNEVEFLLKHVDVPVHMLAMEADFGNFKCENLVRRSPGDTLKIGDHCDITMVHTPGHTPGSACYHVDDVLVTGDTMFVNGCGRCDLVGGDPEVMHASLWGLLDKLPGETVMYPGHNYGDVSTAQLDEQLKTNPWLQHPTLQEFVTHRMKDRIPNTVLEVPPWPPKGGRPG
tara:strand:- start:3939 stop:4649 length:711 start_codon:yes stop_codon:yes gene_type:complete